MDNPSKVSEIMEPAKQDRRKRRTCQLLRQALLELLEEKPYEAISVQDLIARADVARSTFYMHYQDKNDLFLGPEGVFAEKLTQHRRYEIRPRDLGSVVSARVWFEHLEVQRPIVQAISGNSALDLAMQTLGEMLRDDYRKRICWLSHSSVPSEVMVEYVVSTLMVLIRWWLRADPPRTPQQIDELFVQLVRPGLNALVGSRI